MGIYARDRVPDTKKTFFQLRAMLGRFCNGAPQKSPNWGTEFGAENSADCGRLGRPPDESFFVDEIPSEFFQPLLVSLGIIVREVFVNGDTETGSGYWPDNAERSLETPNR